MKIPGRRILPLLLVCMFALGALQPLAADLEPGAMLGYNIFSPAGLLGYMGEIGIFGERFSLSLGTKTILVLPNEFYLRLLFHLDSVSFFLTTGLFYAPPFAFLDDGNIAISSYINVEDIQFSTGWTILGGFGIGLDSGQGLLFGGGVVHDFEFALWRPALSLSGVVKWGRF